MWNDDEYIDILEYLAIYSKTKWHFRRDDFDQQLEHILGQVHKKYKLEDLQVARRSRSCSAASEILYCGCGQKDKILVTF
jgi:hypothetical protein